MLELINFKLQGCHKPKDVILDDRALMRTRYRLVVT